MIKYLNYSESFIKLFFNRRTTLGRFASKGVSAIVCRIASMALWFVLQAVLVQSMGLAAYGEYVYVLAWGMSIAEIGTIGGDKVVLRFAAKYHSCHSNDLLLGIFRYSLRLAFMSGGIFAIALGSTIWLVGVGDASGLRRCFQIVAFLIPLISLTIVSDSYLRALGNIVRSQISSLLIPTVLIVIISSMPVVSQSQITSSTVICAHLTAVAIACITSLIMCLNSQQRFPKVNPSMSEKRLWSSMAFPMFCMTFQNAIQSQCGILLCGYLLGTSQAGVFGLMARISALLGFGLQTINLVAAPMFARLHASGEKHELQNLVSVCAWVSVLFSSVAGVGIVLFWNSIEQLFDAGMQEGYLALGILLVGAIVNSAAGSVGYLLLMSGNHSTCVKVLAVGTLLNLLLGLTMIPQFGISGAAIAQTVATTIWNVALVYLVYVRLGVWSALGKVRVGYCEQVV